MNFFNLVENIFSTLVHENDPGKSRWMSLSVLILLVISTAMTLQIVGLQQEIRQRAECTYECPTVHFEWDSQGEGVAAHYIYAEKVLDVDGHYTCPGGQHLGTGANATKCYQNGNNNFKGNATFVPASYQCPNGYENNPGNSNCRKWVEATNTTVHRTADVKYEKSQDENHCHRPSDSTLQNTYGMDNNALQAFKNANSETKESIKACESPTAAPPTTQPNPTAAPTTSQSNPSSEENQSTPVPTEISGGSNSNDNPEIVSTSVTSDSGGGGYSPRPEGESSSTGAPGIQVCTLSFNGPTQLIGTRLSPTSIRLNWWPTPGGADKQFVMYGLGVGQATWGLMNLAGDQGQIDIDHLPTNSVIWGNVRAYRGNCYEDTGWVSVGSFNFAVNATTVPQQTGGVTPAVTVVPTSISINSAIYTAAANNESEFIQSLVRSVLILLLLFFFALLLLKLIRLFLFARKRRKKKEEEE